MVPTSEPIPSDARSALGSFSGPTRAWFRSAFGNPTPAQALGWPPITAGRNTLVLAPTGSGKTLAALLGVLDRLIAAPAPAALRRCRVLYVSPLKALSADVERNLRVPLAGISSFSRRMGIEPPELTVAVRTGDTAADERRKMHRAPPDVLVTTPESLYLILTSRAQSILETVEVVVVDEVHSLVGNKRGAHLALSLERLERLVRSAGGPSPQRIGCSATQRPAEEAARFLGGQEVSLGPNGEPLTSAPRPVHIVEAGAGRDMDLRIVVPVEDMARLGSVLAVPGQEPAPLLSGPAAGDPESRASIWPHVEPALARLVQEHRSTLVFVDSRRLAERLAARLGDIVGPGMVRAYHGSMSREQRSDLEEQLKAGRLPALVATSALELGIDMGQVDLVVQVGAPGSVSSGLQRVGRAGHRIGEPSTGRIFPKFRHDLLVASACAMRMRNGDVEPTEAPRNPLDVVAQQVIAMVVAEELRSVPRDVAGRSWSTAPHAAGHMTAEGSQESGAAGGSGGAGGAGEVGDRPASPGGMPVLDVRAMVHSAYPFATLSGAALDSVIGLCTGAYPSDEFASLRPALRWDREAGTLHARRGTRMLALVSGGTIPDRGTYRVSTPEGGRVGELDEEMVYECRVGETFVLGASTWRILDISRDSVVVEPAPGIPGKVPFWRGDQAPRPFELGRAVGAFTAEVGHWDDARLEDRCGLDACGRKNLREYLEAEQEATGGLLPTDKQVVVQRFRDDLGDWRLCILSPFGAKVHAPWAMALEQSLGLKNGAECRAVWTDDGIMLRLADTELPLPAEDVLLPADQLEDLVLARLEHGPLFAARFRENASRSLLLPRRSGRRNPLWQQRQRAADLLAVARKYPSFPIVLETYRECLGDLFDMPALRSLMADLSVGRVRLSQVDVESPSPFAASLAFSYVANFIYDGDSPLAEVRAQVLSLDRAMLTELLGTGDMRDLLHPGALAALEESLARTGKAARARDADDAADLLRVLGDLTPVELWSRCSAALGDVEQLTGTLVGSRRALEVRIAGEMRLIAPEDAGRYRDGLGVSPPAGTPAAFLAHVPDALFQLVRRWARVHGPFCPEDVARRWNVGTGEVSEALARLVAAGTVVTGAFRPGGTGQEWCDAEVLERARQSSLAALRQQAAPVPASDLARFLPTWHGIGPQANRESLRQVVGKLQGLPIPASLLETAILSRRVNGYSAGDLDQMIGTGELVWIGAGSTARRDGKVVLAERDKAAALCYRCGMGPWSEQDRLEGDEHRRIRSLLQRRRACFFPELVRDRPASSVVETLEALWDLVWAGEVTNDSFGVVRAWLAAARPRSSRSGPSRAPHVLRSSAWGVGGPRSSGRWSLLSEELGSAPAPTLATSTLVGVLLERHGVLTRSAVLSEGVRGGFASLYPVLSAMEHSGRVTRGYFVEGLGGSQFALPEAIERLRALRDATSPPLSLAISVTDPANPYGTVLGWPDESVQRIAGSWLVLVDGVPSLAVDRAAKTVRALRAWSEPAGDRWEPAAVEAVAALAAEGPLRRARFARLPPELRPWLVSVGFAEGPVGLEWLRPAIDRGAEGRPGRLQPADARG